MNPEEEEEEDGSGRYETKTAMSELFGGIKPVKIRSYDSTRKYGLAVKNVKELLEKACKLLKVRSALCSCKRAAVRVAS